MTIPEPLVKQRQRPARRMAATPNGPPPLEIAQERYRRVVIAIDDLDGATDE